LRVGVRRNRGSAIQRRRIVKVLIVYYSRYGHVLQLARAVEKGVLRRSESASRR
jgi:hypothetical protein